MEGLELAPQATAGTALVSLTGLNLRVAVFPLRRLAQLGFRFSATEGTAGLLRMARVECTEVDEQFAANGIASGAIRMVVHDETLPPALLAAARAHGVVCLRGLDPLLAWFEERRAL